MQVHGGDDDADWVVVNAWRRWGVIKSTLNLVERLKIQLLEDTFFLFGGEGVKNWSVGRLRWVSTA